MQIIDKVEKTDVLDYVYSNIFKTDEFKNSNYIRKFMVEFAKHPRVFAKQTLMVEKSHFSAWFNIFMLRDYTNPWISDLYYMHEFVHAITLSYVPDIPFYKWFEKMTMNEFLTSLETEANVYFNILGLRDKTFDHEIWVDRFIAERTYNSEQWWADRPLTSHATTNASTKLYDSELRRMQTNSPDLFYRMLYDARKEAIRNPNPFDFIELQMANYVTQNLTWAKIWQSHYNIVETIMHKFKSNKLTLDGLLNELQPYCQNDVFFYQEAEAFYAVYKRNLDSNNLMKVIS